MEKKHPFSAAKLVDQTDGYSLYLEMERARVAHKPARWVMRPSGWSYLVCPSGAGYKVPLHTVLWTDDNGSFVAEATVADALSAMFEVPQWFFCRGILLEDILLMPETPTARFVELWGDWCDMPEEGFFLRGKKFSSGQFVGPYLRFPHGTNCAGVNIPHGSWRVYLSKY